MTKPLSGPQTLLRALNARALLEALARTESMTRAELMEETGLSRTAVTQVLRMLGAAEAVTSAGLDRATRGPAATRVSLHPHLGLAAAVHMSHHTIHVSLLDATGTVRVEQQAALGEVEQRAATVSAMIAECRQATPGPLRYVVVGLPGIVTPDGEIRDTLGPDGGAFLAALEERVRCPVRVENDVNLAALAEAASGAGRELSSFTLLLIDEGLGAGTVLDGSLQRGTTGLAGELQYLPLPSAPLGTPAIDATVVADLALRYGRDPAHALAVHLEACSTGDPAAQNIVDELARRLTILAGSVTLIIDPAAFILAGQAAHPCFESAVHRAAEDLPHALSLRFMTSTFGQEATMIGAISEATIGLRERAFTRILSKKGRTTS